MTNINRFNGWVGVLAFSAVVLGALVQDGSERDSIIRYVISCCSIAIGFSFICIMGYFFTDRLAGGIFEASFGVVVFALWCAAIALIMNPNNNLAIQVNEFQKRHEIRNTNIYFFTWAAFLSSCYVLGSISQQYRVVDVQTVPRNLTRWYLFLVSSVIVLGTSSNLKDVSCSDFPTFNSEYCRTTKYGATLGVIGAALALIPIIWTHVAKPSLFVDLVISVIVTVFYCVGAAYITDISGPGGVVGNLYFFTWISFGLSVMLTFTCIKEIISPEETITESQHPEVEKTGQGEGEQQEGTEAKGGDAKGGEEQKGDEEELQDVDVEGRDEAA